MHKSATKCNETLGKWCKNKHGASKIIDMLETYQQSTSFSLQQQYEEKGEKCSHMKEKGLFGKEVVAQVLFEAAPMSV
jgi:hypothetical protein